MTTEAPHHTRSTASGRERVDLPITGMSCAACARHIERSLGELPGVASAGVNLATSRATVEYDPAATGVPQMIEAVKGAGYGAAGTARADFVVDDSARHSGSSAPLKQHLSKLPGVAKADFNLGTMQIRVEYLPGSVSVGQIRKQIESFGYGVTETPAGSTSPQAEGHDQIAREAEYRDLRRKFYIAAALSLPVLIIAMSHGRIDWLNFPGVDWVQFILATPVVFYCGWQFYAGRGAPCATARPT